MWVSTIPPPDGGRSAPCTIRSSPSISTLAPFAVSIAAVADSRSLSLTRSSFSPRIRVVPDAAAAITARIGYSSIMLGARSQAAHRRRAAGPWVTIRSPTGSPPCDPAVLGDHVGAHLGQRGEQAAAQRVQPDALDGQRAIPAPAAPPQAERPRTTDRPARRHRPRAVPAGPAA